VRHQLALVHRLRERREIAGHRRAHLFALLRALWTQLCLVHGATADATATDGGPVARVRALCAEAADQLDAYRSVTTAGV
jgi:hypothetical protein